MLDMKPATRQRLEQLYGAPRWLSVEGFGWHLGWSRYTVYRRIREGAIRGVRVIDGVTRIPYSEIDRYIAEHSEPVEPEARPDAGAA